MDVLPTDMLLEISKYLNDELTFVSRRSLEAYSQLAKLKLNTLDVNTHKLLLGNNDLERYSHYISTQSYNKYTSKYRRGLSYLLLCARSGTWIGWEDLTNSLELATREIGWLDENLRIKLDLDDLARYIGYNCSTDMDIPYLHRVLRIIESLLINNNTTDRNLRMEASLYMYHFILLCYISLIRRDYDVYLRGFSSRQIPTLYFNDTPILFELYRYHNEINIKRLLENLRINIDAIPYMVDERWNYIYNGYYGNLNLAKMLVKGKYAQLLLDYALIGNQPDIVRLCVSEGVNVSRYFDLRPSLVLELKPPNWEFYAIETGDLDVIAKTLESPNSLAINRAFGHVDVVEAMSKQK